MVLVTQPARRQGLGTRLLARTLAEVEARGSGQGLDATELGRPIYLPLGFCDFFPLSRWHAGAGVRQAVAPPRGIVIGAATIDDLPRDRRLRPATQRVRSRRHPGQPALPRAGAWRTSPRRADGTLAGYALGRDGYRTGHVGPVVADNAGDRPRPAQRRALRRTDGAADRWMSPTPHAGIRGWLSEQGASAPRRFMRMLRGTAPARRVTRSRVFALAGPELA